MNKSKYPVRKLAICGLARSGKDSAADYLVEKYEFTKFAFADDMKRLLHDLFPAIPQIPKPRRAYQIFGEGLRNLDLPGASDVWIDACLSKVNTHVWWHSEVDDRGANVVITDLRLPTEYARLKDEGFTIIRVTASLAERVKRAEIAGDAFEMADLEHKTESYVDGFDCEYDVENDGSLDDLKAKVDVIVADLSKN